MHALLAHAYHLAQHGLRLLLLPLWRPPVAALGVAAASRWAGLARTPRGAAMTACTAALAGWLLLDAHWAGWPPPPLARLPGLALVLAGEAWLRTRATPRLLWLVTLAAAALGAWWLRGAPAEAPAILACLPVAIGLAAALPLARRLARADTGSGSVAAALALAGCLMLSGAAVHWARAAVVPAAAALALLGLADAAPALAGTIVVAAASALVASDRGRLPAVDAACLAPLLAWPIAARLAWRAPGRPSAPRARRRGTT